MLRVMSIAVDPAELGEAMAVRPCAYLLSPGRGRPHVVQVVPTLTGEMIHVDAPGRSAVALARDHPQVTLLLPPAAADGHSLIVDGTAHARGDALHIKVEHAVLHRRATADSPPSVTGCGADCQPVEITDP